MQYDSPKKQNIRPKESSNLPIITLSVLVLIVLALLYVGYEYIVDDTSGAEEVTNILPDTSKAAVALGAQDNTETQTSAPAQTPAAAAETPKPEVKKPEAKKPDPVSVGGTPSTHTSAAGETLNSISDRYNLKPETLKGLNPSVSFDKAVPPGTKINIRIQTVHTVGPGDVLRVVSEKYGISKQLLMKANAKSKDFSERGEKLVIPFATKQ